MTKFPLKQLEQQQVIYRTVSLDSAAVWSIYSVNQNHKNHVKVCQKQVKCYLRSRNYFRGKWLVYLSYVISLIYDWTEENSGWPQGKSQDMAARFHPNMKKITSVFHVSTCHVIFVLLNLMAKETEKHSKPCKCHRATENENNK